MERFRRYQNELALESNSAGAQQQWVALRKASVRSGSVNAESVEDAFRLHKLVLEIARTGKLPVVLFTAGGVATPADAALMMQLGADGVFVGSGIFKSGNPAQRAAAIVRATTFFDDPAAVADASRGLGEAMVGINVSDLAAPHRLAERGW